jgi:hypothetical protein
MAEKRHPKTIRRWLLERLYDRYLENPLEMLGPDDFLADGIVDRRELAANMHYLYDRKLVELMTGYAPPMFVAARILPDGIDLVENRPEFNRRFPSRLDAIEESAGDVLDLMDRLVEEVDFSPLDGEERKCLQRDVQYLREEVSRPVCRWRKDVIRQVLAWVDSAVDRPGEELPSLAPLRERTEQLMREGE